MIAEHSRPFRCFVIGEDTLLIECCERLLERGHEILGIITRTERIEEWAKSRSIRTISGSENYLAAISDTPFDYFFSITHLWVVPDEVLALPSKGAINFHDGPLPAYAGLNAPAWALINREENYGVTWHEMVSGVDKGAILESEVFEIAPNETSLTINIKCFEAAIQSFGRLLEKIDAKELNGIAQDEEERTYFGKFKRPAAACSIDWTRPAEEIEALVRALDFGERYRNPLGVATLQKREQLYAVTRAVADSSRARAGAPGEIVSIDADAIVVAAADGVLRIEKAGLLCGYPLTPRELAAHAKVQVGHHFDPLWPETADALTLLSIRIAKSERFWIGRLATLEPLEIPYARSVRPDATEPLYEQVSIPIPEALHTPSEAEGPAPVRTLGAIAAYLSRIAGTAKFDLSYCDPELRRLTSNLLPWASCSVPLRIDFERALSLDAQLPLLAEELGRVRKNRTWLRDAPFRHPETQALSGALTGRYLPVGIEWGDMDRQGTPDAAMAHAPQGRVLTFLVSQDGTECRALFDPEVLAPEKMGQIQHQLEIFLDDLAARPQGSIGRLELLTSRERQTLLKEWNATSEPFDTEACIHHAFEAQVERTPDAPALVFEGETLSYRELNERANQLAFELQALGIVPDDLVGICVERSVDLLVSVLGTLKAGIAYVPLDPDFPKDRIEYMLEDAGVRAVITKSRLNPLLGKSDAPRICIDADRESLARHPLQNPSSSVDSSNLAYVIYTSGSTGKPKGVMVEHRNVINFFAGMDGRIPRGSSDTWLAVTSLSFDISVLELFWTLARGFKVVLYRDRSKETSASDFDQRGIDFSVFLWGSDGEQGSNKYQLMLEAAKFADEHDFSAVWTPERHFHAFGGPYANPAVTGAAIAATTKRVQVRSGSVVLPLHHPVRVAEEWAMVDNISGGRVGIGVASGWQPDDFLLRPENHKDAREVLFSGIETLRALWRGETRAFPGPLGKDVGVCTQPRPIQKEVPIWVAIAGNPDSYRRAGELGANVLTHLLGQSLDEVAANLAIYRKALVENGFDEDYGKVTLMLHTFVGENDDEVRDIVRGPLKSYLGSSVNLAKKYAASFPTFRKPNGSDSALDDIDFDSLPAEDVDAIIEHSFLRYYETSGLLGSAERCMDMIRRCKEIGIDEIGCLLDFGVETERVLEALPALNALREEMNEIAVLDKPAESPTVLESDYSIPALIRDHAVSHLQCTPSMARMISMDPDASQALEKLRCMMVGGEAFPVDLAVDLERQTSGEVINMYGPTETTIWSSTHALQESEANVPIGRPIANTQLYVLDEDRQPVPPGISGDLYIGGAGVVRGYLKRPELTTERFIADPFAEEAAARIYNTGDQARFRDDGVLEFLGRNDHQVKIRGYRIELGEIEVALLQTNSVRECVVVAREDNPGDQRIVAYLLTEEPLDAESLAANLRRELPEYMVPSHFVQLQSFPLTPNGKVDRNAFPAPDRLENRSSTSFIAPENELESTLAEIWKRVLALENVSIHENFFDLGGHSLLLVRMHQELQETLGKRIDLTTLYQNPNIRSLAEHLQSKGGGAGAQVGKDRAARRRAMGRRR